MPGTDTLKLFHDAFGYNRIQVVMILVNLPLTKVITYQPVGNQSTNNRVATCRELLNQSSLQMLIDHTNVTVRKKFVGLLVSQFTS